MVFRVLLTGWFLIASVCAPALCCCAPVAAHAAVRDDVARHAAPPAPVKPSCPHCKGATQSAPELPGEKTPCPSHPDKDHCPCKQGQFVQTVPPAPELRAVVDDWLPDLVPFAPAPKAYATHSLPAPRLDRHTGPPPPAGVDLLRRLQILIC